MAPGESRRGLSEVLFIALLLLLSPIAVWYVEWERPQRERQAAQTVTAFVPTATAIARENATAAERLMVDYRQGYQTATVRARRTASARYIVTARTDLVATARILTLTADLYRTSLSQTGTQRAATSAAHARLTATVRTERTSVAAMRHTEAAILAPTFAARARQTVTARVLQTATAQANRSDGSR